MKKLTPVYGDVAEAVAAGETVTTTVQFLDNDNVFFEPTKGGMQVVMKAEPLPPFEGNMFSQDFADYMYHHKLSDVAVNQVYDAVHAGLRKGLVLDAILDCMK